MIVYSAHGQTIKLKTPWLGKGGQGEVYEIQNNPRQAAKIFFADKLTPNLSQKLEYMILNPPKNPTEHLDHTSFAWPQELIYDKNQNFIGYLMPKLEGMVSLYRTLHPKLKNTQFNWQYSVATAKNLAQIVNILHRHGYIIGDLNESNIMVSNRALVSVLDCDSMQVSDISQNKTYFCEVKKDDYLPAELQTLDLKTTTRYEYHDNFILAILIFQLLMRGVNPYSGSGATTIAESIKHNHSFVISNSVHPPSGSPSLEVLPPHLINKFEVCFERGYLSPNSRPTAEEWIEELDGLANNLSSCNNHHFHSNHLNYCPWCKLEQAKTKVSKKQQPRRTYFPSPNPTPATRPTPIHTSPQIKKPNPIALIFDKYEHLDSVVAFTGTALVCGGITSILDMSIGWDSSHVWHITFLWGAGIAAVVFLIISAIASDPINDSKGLIWGGVGTILITIFLPWIIAGMAFVLVIAFIITFLIGMISG